MKIGDLVRDEFGNVGIIMSGPAVFGNGVAYLIFFDPSIKGYFGARPWIFDSMLELVSEAG